MMKQLADLPFRGQRNYVHGTHLFERLVAIDSDPTDIDLSFHRQIYHQCEVASQLQPDRKKDLVATYQSRGSHYFVYENSFPVTNHVECLESKIEQALSFTGKTVSFSLPVLKDATFIESVVAAYKKLLLTLYPENERYLFARLILQKIPAAGEIEIVQQRQLGPSFYQGALKLNAQPLGSIFFGVP